MKHVLLFLLLISGISANGQTMPYIFTAAQTDSIFPKQIAHGLNRYQCLNDIIDYKARKIRQVSGNGTDRYFDTQGRIVTEISRKQKYPGDTISCFDTTSWEYFNGGTRIFEKRFMNGKYIESRKVVFDQEKSFCETKEAKQESPRTEMIRYFIDGKWEIYYSAKYDSAGRLTEQFENAAIEPNAYFNSRVLRSQYVYNENGKIISAKVMSDSGMIMTESRFLYNSNGQLLINDSRGIFRTFGIYDSLVYNSAGKLVYEFHSDGDMKNSSVFQYEYNQSGNLIRFVHYENEAETETGVFEWENGLLVSEKETIRKPGQIDYHYSRSWKYYFYP